MRRKYKASKDLLQYIRERNSLREEEKYRRQLFAWETHWFLFGTSLFISLFLISSLIYKLVAGSPDVVLIFFIILFWISSVVLWKNKSKKPMRK